MKKRWIVRVGLCSLLALGVNSLAAPYGAEVTTTSRKILPPAYMTAAGTAWVASTPYLTQGAYVTNSAGRVYMVATTGTTSTASIAGEGDIVDGTVIWRSTLQKTRTQLLISNLTTNKLFYAFDTTAVTNKGGYIAAGATMGWTDKDTPQESISMILDGSSGYVTILDK